MSALDLLKHDITKYIYDQGWQELRKIQEAAILKVHSTDHNLILAAPTASGKTEAAFIPAINDIDNWDIGVKILYVSPLIALINDQFKRITELCEYLDVPVTSWHGEASRTAKDHLIKNPRGILLITPESIEAMLVNRPGEAERLFSGVEWVIVDELHNFLDTTRGVHVKSLLGRIQSLAKKSPRYIGMTATLNRSSYENAKDFFGNQRSADVLLDSSRNDLTTTLMFKETEAPGTPPDIIDDIFKYSCSESMLVFPNARGRVEEISVGLKRRSKKVSNKTHYFAHHASVDKELRLEAEEFAKASTYDLFTICCTSTLELGIDIGSVDSVAQVEGAPSVASLAQRLGRSGRKEHHSILHMYASKDWSLLQNIATLELYKRGTIEEVAPIKKPYTVLLQQILSILLQESGLSRNELIKKIKSLNSWGDITLDEISVIIDHLVKIDFIEAVDNELVVGIGAERTIKSRDFYAHFASKTDFRVVNDHEHIGEIPLSMETIAGANIYLAARIWKIEDIDIDAKKIYVSPAHDGKPPIFGGGAGDISHLVRREMLARLRSTTEYDDQYDQPVASALLKLAKENLTSNGEDLLLKDVSTSKQTIMTFAGSRINRTILLFLKVNKNDEHKLLEFSLDDFESSISGPNLRNYINALVASPIGSRHVRRWLLDNQESIKEFVASVKYLDLLPTNLQIEYLIENYFDIENTNAFLLKRSV